MRAALLLALACSGSPEAPPSPEPAAPSAPGERSERAPAAGVPGWRDALAVEVSALPPPRACPDADGDGFPDARACPGLPPERADCDDADPAVTPETERYVPPGPFLMGEETEEAGDDERPVHVVVLSGYCLDRLEATRAEVAAFRGAPAPPPDEARLPATDLDAAEAAAYCAARGKALPTEAQWEKAARGGCELGEDPARCDPADLARRYPWGTAPPDCRRANHRGGTGCPGRPLPVGSLPDGAGPYGHLDLAGNAWEPVADLYHPRAYDRPAPRIDPGGPERGTAHVLRGGAWNTFPTNMRAANRMSDLVAGSEIGVRCARPFAPARPEPVPADAPSVVLRGTVRRAGGLAGRALYVAAFSADDLDPATGAPLPGRSPAAEVRMDPAGGTEQPFAIEVPAGGRYLLMAALDDASGRGPAPSGGGGVGALGPVDAGEDRSGLVIEIRAPGSPGPPGGRAPRR